MKKLKKYWIAAFFVFAGLLQSCDDDEGYSIGDIANDWVTIRLKEKEYTVSQVTLGEQCILLLMLSGTILL